MAITIGWTTDEAYNTFLETRSGFIDNTWTADHKTGALTTAYNRLRFSSLLSIPASPSAEELELLAYAQHEYAINFNLLAEEWAKGEKQRLSIIGNGVTEANLVEEKYDKTKADANKSKIPNEIIDILDEFKTNLPVRTTELFRNENDNVTYDNNMPPEYS
jgi:hypothetical protein